MKRPWRKFPLWFALTALLLSPIAVWIVDRTLAPAARTLEGSDYQRVQLTFSGQQAILQGEVRSPRAREAASHFAATQIRVGPRWWNGTLNPIASVRNELQLSPPGFVLLLRHGPNHLLAGETFDATEREQLTTAATHLFPSPPDTLLLHSAQERGQAPALETTLASLRTAPESDTPALLAATLGQPIESLDITLSDNQLQELFTNHHWNWEIGQPLIAQYRTWTHDEAERTRQLSLPPPHLLLLAAGETIHLRGNLPTTELKDIVTDTAQKHYAPLTVLDEITLTDERRPVPASQLTETLATLPPAPDPHTPGTYAFAIPGHDWITRELTPEDNLADIHLTPSDFPATLIAADHTALTATHAQYLTDLANLAATENWPQPYLALLLTAHHVELRGTVPTEALKANLLTTATTHYAPLPLRADLLIDPTRRPLTLKQADPTLTTWPPLPAETSPGTLSFTLLHTPWTTADVPSIPLRPEEMDDFLRLKLLPPSVPTDDVRDAFQTFAPTIATQSLRLKGLQIDQHPPRPYLALLALGNEIILRGDAGSESLKATLLTAARTFYKNRQVIDELRIDSNTPLKPGFTTKTFPPAPSPTGPGLLGFCLPGQPWLQVPLTWDTPTLDTLQNAGLFSKIFDPAQAWPDYANWLPKLAARRPPPTSK